MTNKQAIEELNAYRNLWKMNTLTKACTESVGWQMIEALDMAIEALSNSQNQTNSELKTTTESVSATDVIYRADAIIAFEPDHRRDWYTPEIIETLESLPPAQSEHLVKESGDLVKDLVNDCISRQEAIDAFRNRGDEIIPGGILRSTVYEVLEDLTSALPEIIRCKDCVYYDPPHVENNGVRSEYSEMPEDAFDVLGAGLVSAEYGINIGGRCCRDYNVGYSEDKRVFVPETNYCGRAERKENG